MNALQKMNNLNTPVFERGAALVISLIVLAIITLIGVIGSKNSMLEILMSGNEQYSARAFNNSESSLVIAENMASTLKPSTTYAQSGVFNVITDGANDPYTMAWDDSDSQKGQDDNSRYMVEYVGSEEVKGNSSKWGGQGAGALVHVFRATARSEDGRGAVRMVQSIWVNE
jgi:type IV pilus assembly protein PilX